MTSRKSALEKRLAELESESDGDGDGELTREELAEAWRRGLRPQNDDENGVGEVEP